MAKPNLFQALVAKQYDSNSRFLKVTLVNNGEKIEIDPSAIVIINADRKDGQSNVFQGVANDDGTATVPLTLWMLELEGTLICDVSIIDEDSRKLTSTSFTVLVEKASNGEVSPDDEVGIFRELLEAGEAANNAAEAANNATETANIAAENANIAASVANKAAERADDSNISVVLVEQNEENHLRFWLGNSDEYAKQVDSMEKDTVCIITDDPRDENIRQLAEKSVIEMVDLGGAPFQYDPQEFSFFIAEMLLDNGSNGRVLYTNVQKNPAKPEVTAQAFEFDDEGSMWRYRLRFYLENGNWMVESMVDSYTIETQTKASATLVYINLYGVKTPF